MSAKTHAAMLAWMLLLFGSDATLAQAQTQVRGRIDYRDPVTTFPMVNASVQLCSTQPPNACTTYVTGSDGMYYLSVPPGNYELKVNGTSRGTMTIPDQPVYGIDPQPGN
jgi:hypothetical protein